MRGILTIRLWFLFARKIGISDRRWVVLRTFDGLGADDRLAIWRVILRYNVDGICGF